MPRIHMRMLFSTSNIYVHHCRFVKPFSGCRSYNVRITRLLHSYSRSAQAHQWTSTDSNSDVIKYFTVDRSFPHWDGYSSPYLPRCCSADRDQSAYRRSGCNITVLLTTERISVQSIFSMIMWFCRRLWVVSTMNYGAIYKFIEWLIEVKEYRHTPFIYVT